MRSKEYTQVYQLKVTLRDIKPPIWRRLLVPETTTLAQLHKIIQVAMEWEDYHLFMFLIGDDEFGIPSRDDIRPMSDARRFRLNRLAPAKDYKFSYVYDFVDCWDQDILVEKVLPAEPGGIYPVCIKGKRASPPEDIGGYSGYMYFLESMADPYHPSHERYVDWWGQDAYDAELFEMDEINQELLNLH